jgi:hypothetical protein
MNPTKLEAKLQQFCRLIIGLWYLIKHFCTSLLSKARKQTHKLPELNFLVYIERSQ